MVKDLPAMQETQIQSLGWEDLLEKGMAIHFTIHAWRIPWTCLVGYNSLLDMTEATKQARVHMRVHAHARAHTHTHTF